MEYTQFERSIAWAFLRSKLARRTNVGRDRHPKLIRLSPGKQFALGWRIEAAHRVQAGRQRLAPLMVKNLSERLPDDRTGLAEGLIYETFSNLARQVDHSKDGRVQVDIVPILWHLPSHLVNALASEILANPSFDEVDLDRWLDRFQIDRKQTLPNLKQMKNAAPKA